MRTGEIKRGGECGDTAAGLPQYLGLVTTNPRSLALEALELMHENGIHHLLVVHEGQLVGIVSDRDILRAAFKAHAPGEIALGLNLSVQQAMHPNPPHVDERTTVQEALRLMLDNGLSALPLFKCGRPSGIVTEKDMLRALALQLSGTPSSAGDRSDIDSAADHRGGPNQNLRVPSTMPLAEYPHAGEEVLLANPLVQNLMSLVSAIGI